MVNTSQYKNIYVNLNIYKVEKNYYRIKFKTIIKKTRF